MPAPGHNTGFHVLEDFVCEAIHASFVAHADLANQGRNEEMAGLEAEPMMMNCPIHGFAGVCICSPALLELRADGTLPDVVTVEVKDAAEEEAFFRFNVSQEEAAKLPVVDGRIPFDLDAADIIDGLPSMCGFCFGERREALQQQARRSS
jgi:hypothetical protein